MKKVCVFCGSSPGTDTIYSDYAYKTGKEIASRGYTLVYGGSTLGLMGITAQGALSEKGKVIAVMPEFFKEMVEQPELDKIILAEGMHDRKNTMYEISDLFIILPGGLGTMEEGLEALTWCQLGLMSKPVGFLNVNGFFDELLNMFTRMHQDGFVRKEHIEMIVNDNDPCRLLDKLIDHKIPRLNKWLDENGNLKHI